MAEKKQKKTTRPNNKTGQKKDAKWLEKSVDNQTMDGLGVSFEEAMKVLSKPNFKNDN